MSQKNLKPVLKWAGGKRQLLPEIKKRVPETIKKYYEPFLGGGAVLFSLQPKHAVVNDLNPGLINIYSVIRDNVEELIEDLKNHKNESDYFYNIRGQDRTPEYRLLSPVKRASRLIYLNKTCYNGLFRVNKNGEFNSPFGRYKNPDIVNEDALRAVSFYLNKNDIQFLNVDFDNALAGIRRGAFVYFDPPYYPVSDSSNFTGYTMGGFTQEDQMRLKELCDRLDRRGIKWLMSNSSSSFITDLFGGYCIDRVRASRVINSNAGNRGNIEEVLIRNYEIKAD